MVLSPLPAVYSSPVVVFSSNAVLSIALFFPSIADSSSPTAVFFPSISVVFHSFAVFLASIAVVVSPFPISLPRSRGFLNSSLGHSVAVFPLLTAILSPSMAVVSSSAVLFPSEVFQQRHSSVLGSSLSFAVVSVLCVVPAVFVSLFFLGLNFGRSATPEDVPGFFALSSVAVVGQWALLFLSLR